jgi:hypothetical protein
MSKSEDLAVGATVRVYAGTERETSGVLVEDFGSAAGQPVHIGEEMIVPPARRWAVLLDDGTLVFLDDDQLGEAG